MTRWTTAKHHGDKGSLDRYTTKVAPSKERFQHKNRYYTEKERLEKEKAEGETLRRELAETQADKIGQDSSSEDSFHGLDTSDQFGPTLEFLDEDVGKYRRREWEAEEDRRSNAKLDDDGFIDQHTSGGQR